jgi:hypothetical protein
MVSEDRLRELATPFDELFKSYGFELTSDPVIYDSTISCDYKRRDGIKVDYSFQLVKGNPDEGIKTVGTSAYVHLPEIKRLINKQTMSALDIEEMVNEHAKSIDHQLKQILAD